MRDEPIEKPPTKLVEQEEGFQLLQPHRKGEGSEDEYDVKIVRREKPKPKEEVYEKKKKRKREVS